MITTETFNQFSDAADQVINAMMEEGFAPSDTKELKKWNMAEVAEILDCSASFLKKLIDKNAIPSGVMKGNRRVFSIHEINTIRDYLVENNPTKYDKFSHFREKEICLTIGIANFKGGVGKSTTSITLAHDLALRGYRVLLVDCDGQGSSTTMCGFNPNSDIEDHQTIEPFIESFLPEIDRFDGFNPTDLGYSLLETNWGDNLDLIAANLTTSYADFSLSMMHNEGVPYWKVLKRGLQTIESNYDVILLDFPPSLGYFAMNGIFASDSLIIPIPPDMLDFSSAAAFFSQLADVSNMLDAKESERIEYNFVKLLMTKSPIANASVDIKTLMSKAEGPKERGNRQAKKIKALMLAAFGENLLKGEIVLSEAYKEASSNFKSIFELDATNMTCARSTLKRALESTRSAHDEIEQLIQVAMSQKIDQLEQSGDE